LRFEEVGEIVGIPGGLEALARAPQARLGIALEEIEGDMP